VAEKSGGKIWEIEEHLERLYESARMRGWKLSWTPTEIAKAVEKTVQKNEYPESRVRITITPGVKLPTLFIWVQPLEKLPASVYSRGVSAITFPLERPFPQMKTTSIQPLLIARAEMFRKRAFDAILINRNELFKFSFS
jgi:branched-subunit amino acid aminotransferase/4-amino-4-deoxychorismate lyase